VCVLSRAEQEKGEKGDVGSEKGGIGRCLLLGDQVPLSWGIGGPRGIRMKGQERTPNKVPAESQNQGRKKRFPIESKRNHQETKNTSSHRDAGGPDRLPHQKEAQREKVMYFLVVKSMFFKR